MLFFLGFAFVIASANAGCFMEKNPIPLDCTQLRDGPHAMGCTRFYTVCTENEGRIESCDDEKETKGQFFDGIDRICKPKDKIRGCSKLRCLGKKNGFHSNGCSPAYYTCWQGIYTEICCDGGRFYDEKAGKCNYPNNVDACHYSVKKSLLRYIRHQ